MTAKENLALFYQDVLEIGEMARMAYTNEVRAGKRQASFVELREFDMNIAAIKQELERIRA